MITIVVPFEKSNPQRLALLKNLVEGLSNQTNKNFETLFVIDEDDIDNLEIKMACGKIKHSFIPSPNESNFAQKINIGVTNVVATDYFAILNYTSDVLSSYTKMLVETQQHYTKAAYLPLVLDLSYNAEDKSKSKIIGLSNVYFWHKHVGVNTGEVELATLLNPEAALATSLNGALINSQTFIRLGGLKQSMDMFYDLEFLLRLREFGEEVFVSPRIGVKNYHKCIESDFFDYSNIMQEERIFWLKLAESEYKFDYDREKKYTGVEVSPQ